MQKLIFILVLFDRVFLGFVNIGIRFVDCGNDWNSEARYLKCFLEIKTVKVLEYFYECKGLCVVWLGSENSLVVQRNSFGKDVSSLVGLLINNLNKSKVNV